MHKWKQVNFVALRPKTPLRTGEDIVPRQNVCIGRTEGKEGLLACPRGQSTQ